MRVLITGAGGLLGFEATRAFSSHEVYAAEHAQLDVCVKSSIEKALDSFAPDWVVNCAAAADVDRCEIDRAWADALNFTAPRLMSELCALRGIRLLHVSTDYVFNGETEKPYTETDAPQPINYYGETKLCGEQPVLESGGTVVRTQWLYGRKKAGLIKRVLHQAHPKIITDCTGCPTWAKDVAKTVVQLAEKGCGGLYHVANAGCATWFDYAEEIARLWKCEVDLVPVSVWELNLAAKRPQTSMLDCAKLRSVRIEPPRDWRAALAEFYKTEGGRL